MLLSGVRRTIFEREVFPRVLQNVPNKTCIPFHSVAEDYDDFDIIKILEHADVPPDTISLYTEGRLLTISWELGILHPELHPEMGAPGDSPIFPEYLLGPNIDESQVELTLISVCVFHFPKQSKRFRISNEGCVCVFQFQMAKFWQRFSQTGTARDDFLGGFLEIDLDSEEEGDGEAEDDEDFDLVQETARGFHKCPRCEHDSRKYGARARINIAGHAKKCHASEYDAVMADYYSKYNGARVYTTQPLSCPHCEKTLHGHSGALNRHIRSCSAQQQGEAGAKKKRKR